jgi:NAD+ synthase (glutamine-hydrolysing)
MYNNGFVRVAAAVPYGSVAGITANTSTIISLIEKGVEQNVSVVVFPELSITGYTCGDLFHRTSIIEDSITAICTIAEETASLPVMSIVGLPVINENQLYNCAAVIQGGTILGIVPKSFIPGYREFYEPRWFSGSNSNYSDTLFINKKQVPFGTDLLFKHNTFTELIIGIEICEDVWVPIPPSSYQALAGATLLCNLSASNVLVGKRDYRRDLIINQSARCLAAYCYVSAGTFESTTDVVFDADATIVENGVVVVESERFLRDSQLICADVDIERLVTDRVRQNSMGGSEKEYRVIEWNCEIPETTTRKGEELKHPVKKHPFVPSVKQQLSERCNEIFTIQATGLARRIESVPGIKAIIGVSGGLDSTLALLVTVRAFTMLDRPLDNITAVTMPGFGTTDRTYNNAVTLCNELGVSLDEIPIRKISSTMFEMVNHDENDHSPVYENIQARARTYVLMTRANQEGALVIGTGDLSEIALGWSTYNGDHISMYNVNSSIPKTLVRFLVSWAADTIFQSPVTEILEDVVEQPISPELLPTDGQTVTHKTEDTIGPYELHDFFLYNFMRYGYRPTKIMLLAEIAFKGIYSKDVIKKWLVTFYRRFFSNQWKRDCVPAGPKVGSIDLSPRGTWRMPSEADVNDFLRELDKI